MPRQTQNSQKSAGDILRNQNSSSLDMDSSKDGSSGSGLSLEERMTQMEERNQFMLKDFQDAMSDIKSLLLRDSSSSKKKTGRRQHQQAAASDEAHLENLEAETEPETEEAEPETSEEDTDTDDEAEPWRHLRTNLVKCQQMVEKWPGPKKMDFMLWSVHFRRAARSLDIWEIFKDNMKAPKQSSDLKIFRKHHFICFQFLERLLPHDVAINLQPFEEEANSSRQAWKYLQKKYEQATDDAIRSIRNCLLSIKKQPEESGKEFLTRAEGLRNSLAARKVCMDDTDYTNCIIDGLKDFPAFSTIEQQYVAAKEDGRPMSPEALE